MSCACREPLEARFGGIGVTQGCCVGVGNCVTVCMHVYAPFVCSAHRDQKVWDPLDELELKIVSCGCWELNPGPLKA